jgi:hypothetical protein
VFHDNLITRLKALSQIQLDFDKRTKEVESRFMEKLNDMRKQLDMRWKQIDKFEVGVKGYAEAKAGWRRKLSAKEGELEAVKVCALSFMMTVIVLTQYRRPTRSWRRSWRAHGSRGRTTRWKCGLSRRARQTLSGG